MAHKISSQYWDPHDFSYVNLKRLTSGEWRKMKQRPVSHNDDLSQAANSWPKRDGMTEDAPGNRDTVCRHDPVTLVDPTDWHGMDVPERSWFIDGLIPSRTVTLLSGDGGLGKSLVALQIGVAACLDMPTLGLKPAFGGVLYVGAEDEQDEFHRRLHEILRTYHCDFSDLTGLFRLVPLAERDAVLAAPDRTGKMVPTPLMISLKARISEFRPSFIVLDTSADLFGGDEIKRSQVRQFVAMLRAIAIDLDCAVLLLSHPSISGMQSGSGTSGSTAWNNSVRSRLYLTADKGDDADPDVRVLTTMKANYGRAGDAIRMRWQAGAFVLEDGKGASPATGMLHQKHDAKFLALLSAVGRTGQRVAPTKGTNYAPKILAARPDAAPCTLKHLEGAMHRLLASGEVKVLKDGPPSKERQKLVVTSEIYGGAA